MKRFVAKVALNLAGVIALILIWWWASATEFIKPILLPPPQAVAREVINFVKIRDALNERNALNERAALNDLWLSAKYVAFSFIMSIVIGTTIGIMFGLLAPLAWFFEIPVEFFRALPAPVLYPLFMLLFGIGDETKLFLVIFVASLVNLVYAMYGVRNCPTMRLKAARAMRLNWFRLFCRVIFPESLPNILAGLRISLSLVLILVVVLEMLRADRGIGKRIYDASQTFQTKEMYAAIVVVGLLGYILNKLLALASERFVHWGGK